MKRHAASVSGMECIVDRCRTVPSEEITVKVDDLLIVYSVCVKHREQALRGDLFASSPDPLRGLIGPA